MAVPNLQGLLRHVLSIQSHVVHGVVGNKSAVFPLQVLGFEVDTINSVQFSNHTGYEHIKGQVLQERELSELIEGLEANDLLKSYSHLLTGYIGNASFLRRIKEIVQKLRHYNPNLIYVCDPVMGDEGQLYVPKELLPIYRDEIVPLADIITPNQFELELLTDVKIRTEADIWSAVQQLHARNIDTVVVSSTQLGDQSTISAYLSKRNGPRFTLTIPKQGSGISFTGVGDLFTALFLAHSYQTPQLGNALENTIASLQSVIRHTIEQLPQEVRDGKRAVTTHERELKLIQSKEALEKPNVVLKAKQIV